MTYQAELKKARDASLRNLFNVIKMWRSIVLIMDEMSLSDDLSSLTH